MCGRYTLKNPEQIKDFFELDQVRIEWRPRFNIPPTVQIPVIRNSETGRELVGVRWGLVPSWAKEGSKLPLMINARAETIAEKPAYRSSFKKRRCLFPMSGYFEWKLEAGRKQPYYFTPAAGEFLAVAGIWECGKDDQPDTAALITTAPNEQTAVIHDRMPVILPKEKWERWLSEPELTPEERGEFLTAAPVGALNIWPVSPRVSSNRIDDPSLIEPWEEGPLPTKPQKATLPADPELPLL